MLKIYKQHRQVHTRSGMIHDLPDEVKKDDILALISTSKFIDLGDEIVPVDQIRTIRRNTITDEVEYYVSQLPQDTRSKTREFLRLRQQEGKKTNVQIIQNWLQANE